MDRTFKKIITAAATAAATMGVATVATSPATAATFRYTGDHPLWSAAGLAITSETASSVDELVTERGNGWWSWEVETSDNVVGGKSLSYRSTSWHRPDTVTFHFLHGEDGLNFNVSRTTLREEFSLEGVVGGSSEQPTTSVPEPSSAIALVGVAALGAVASKRRRRS